MVLSSSSTNTPSDIYDIQYLKGQGHCRQTCERPLRTLLSMASLDICASILAVACEMSSEACLRVLLLSFKPGSACDSFRASMRSCLLEGLCASAVVPA